MKSTVEQIRRRFDNDVERFSNLPLRGDDKWLAVFRKCYLALNPGGLLWIAEFFAGPCQWQV